LSKIGSCDILAKEYRDIKIKKEQYLKLLELKSQLSKQLGQVASFSDVIEYLLEKAKVET